MQTVLQFRVVQPMLLFRFVQTELLFRILQPRLLYRILRGVAPLHVDTNISGQIIESVMIKFLLFEFILISGCGS